MYMYMYMNMYVSHVLSGDVTFENVLEVLPFGNFVYMVRVTGATIMEALEHSASFYSLTDPDGAFLQFSGANERLAFEEKGDNILMKVICIL